MGWQQFLNNSSVPLKRRLHGAHVAFLASSSELSTQQKEDVVILWLTRLVKEKQMSTWQEDTDHEQEQVWQLLDQLFSSQRLQQLIRKAWTCPITSAFPQSIIDVLGAPALGAETRRLVVSTVCSIICTPALATVITNSATLSLQVTTALLDAVICASWERVETERLNLLPGDVENEVNLAGLDQPTRLQVDLHSAEKCKFHWQYHEGQTDEDSRLMQGLLHDEKVLKSLIMLVDDVASQLLVKNDDSAVKFCCQQLLKRLVGFELSADAYNGPAKVVLLGKMEKLIKDSLFNSNVVAQYAAFLSFLQVEDCKAFSEVSLIPVVLSSISAIMSSESLRAASRIVTLFFEGFLDRFIEDEHRVKMLACLLHMAGVALLGDIISCDSEAFQFIDRMPLDARAQEGILVALIKPLQRSERIAPGSQLSTYLVLLLQHLTGQQPLSCDWFKAIRGLLMLLPENHTEELKASVGEMVTAAKPDEQALDVVSDLLNYLLQHYASTSGPVAFVSVLIQSIIAKQDKLRSYKEIIPFVSLSDRSALKLLLPPQFLGSLSSVLGHAQPFVFCDLLSALFTSARDLLLPLFSAAEESAGRALSGCCWVLSAVLGGACPARVVSVQHFAADLMQCISMGAELLMDPLLRLLADQDKPDPALCCGVLLLSHAFASFVQELRCCDTFALAWQESSSSLPLSLVPLTCSKTWALLIAKIEACTDVTTRCLFLRLIVVRLQHLHTEKKRAAARGFLSSLSSNTQARHSAHPTSSPSKALISHGQDEDELDGFIASLCKSFMTILEGSCAKDALKLVRDLLCDNLLSSMHVMPSCHKTVVRVVLNAYLTSPKLVQKTILGDANLAVLLPQMVQSALVVLASTIKSDKALGSVSKKRKWDSGETKVERTKGDLDMKRKKRKFENGETDAIKNEVKDNSIRLESSEEMVENQVNCHDDLLAILHTVNVRLHCLEEGDDKKRIGRNSMKMKQHLERIIEEIKEGHDVAPIDYNDHDTAAQICNFFLDIKIGALSESQIVAVLQAFIALFLLSDVKDKKQKKIILSLLRCTSVCFQALPVTARIVSPKQLPALAKNLISLRCCPSSVFATSKENAGSNLVVYFDTTLNFVLRQLVQLKSEVDHLGSVAEFLVQSAGAAAATRASYATRTALEERHLQTAWQLVSHCAQVVKDAPDKRSIHCRTAMRTLALWCMSTSGASAQVPLQNSAFCILAIYSELLAIEQRSSITQDNKSVARRTCQSESGSKNMQNGVHDSDIGAFQDETILNNKNTNEKFDTNPAEENTNTDEVDEAKHWDHLPTAWRLAQTFLSNNSALLQSCALQFLMQLKHLPPHLRSQCPDEDISRSFLGFLQAQMSNVSRCKDTGLLPHYIESFNVTISMNKKSEFRKSMDQSTVNKQALAEFLKDCPLERYQSLLGDLLKRSLSLDDFLVPRIMGLWHLLIAVNVGSIEGQKAKRSALRTLTQILIRHLQSRSSSASSCKEHLPGLSARSMVSVLEMLTTIMKQSLSLPYQTVMQVLSATAVSTSHLSMPDFSMVWQKQVSLLSSALVSRARAWPDRVSGLLSALLTLITTLAQRSSAHNSHADAHKEVLTSCCLKMEQLLRKLHPLQRDLSSVLHLTTGSIIAALQQHSVIPPVRSVLDAEIYKLLKMCSSTGLDHLAVALPVETRPLFHHYRNNFNKYYAVDHTKE